MTVSPGAEGQPLPQGSEVFRLFRATNDGRFAPEAFHLSSEDKAQSIPRLSVWEVSLTKVTEADAITEGKNTLAGYLLVDEVRKLRPEPDHDGVQSLDVEWEVATEKVDGREVPSSKPGAAGHAGITRLNQERAADGTLLKTYRKSLYARLARMANERKVAPIR